MKEDVAYVCQICSVLQYVGTTRRPRSPDDSGMRRSVLRHCLFDRTRECGQGIIAGRSEPNYVASLVSLEPRKHLRAESMAVSNSTCRSYVGRERRSALTTCTLSTRRRAAADSSLFWAAKLRRSESPPAVWLIPSCRRMHRPLRVTGNA